MTVYKIVPEKFNQNKKQLDSRVFWRQVGNEIWVKKATGDRKHEGRHLTNILNAISAL